MSLGTPGSRLTREGEAAAGADTDLEHASARSSEQLPPRRRTVLRDVAASLERRSQSMAAILFLVAILGLLSAGRTQARAAYGSKPLFSFKVWQLGLAFLLPLVCAAAGVPTVAKLIAVASTASAFSLSVFRARHARDLDELYF